MPQQQNAPGRKAEGVVCLHSRADADAYTAEVRALQLVRTRLPILCTHVGLDRLAASSAELGS